jgi:integrase
MPRKQAQPYLRGKIWWVKYYANGEPQYESSKSEKYEDAVRLLKIRQGEVAGGNWNRPDNTKVGTLLDDLLDFYKRNRRSHDHFAQPYVEKNLRPFWGNYLACRVTTKAVGAYRKRRQRQGAAPATINRELALLRRSFRLGMRATPQKVTHVPHFEMAPENNVRVGFLVPEQYERLLSELPRELKPLLVVGYHVGCRRGEALPLRIDQVDMEAREITLHSGETKNSEGRVLPIYGDMVEALEAQFKEIREKWPRCKYVFHRYGKPIKDFRGSWEAACDRAGLPGLLFHDLRRSAVRNMVRAGIPEGIAMKISGHKTRSVFERYNIVSGKDLEEAGAKLAAFLDGRRNGKKG